MDLQAERRRSLAVTIAAIWLARKEADRGEERNRRWSFPDCLQKCSSFPFSQSGLSGPTADKRRGHKRKQQLMMASDGKTARAIGFSTGRSRWALHYILQRTIVLYEIEVRSGNWP